MECTEQIISIKPDITKVVNFALQQNRIPVVREVAIFNAGAESMENVVLRITSVPEFAFSYEKNLEYIPTGSTLTVKDVSLLLDAETLVALTERITGVLCMSLTKDNVELAEHKEEITVLAFNEWHGSDFFPELLTAFVTPNHPEIAKLNAKASELLGRWTGNNALDAYQSKSPDRVKKQFAAVYGALQEQNLVYAVSPASFETMGQRVRLCDVIMQQHMANCLDLTLLYASCLEAIGLRPLLILQKGHIFLDVWLEDMSFPEAVSDDPALITKRLSDDIAEIAVVECTALVAGKNLHFNEAEQAARRSLQGIDSLQYIIDVHRARITGIRPMPMRILTESGWVIETPKRDETELTNAPTDMWQTVVVSEGAGAPASKRIGWERKLLDLSLRNALINLRLSRNIIPILSSSLFDLEDALADGSEFSILPRPTEWAQQKGTSISSDFENICDVGLHSQLIQAEFKNKRLRSPFSEGDLNRAVINLYRGSKTALEENGANTLYLACGLLRWFETKSSQKPRYAPLVLLPIEIVRKSALKGYVIRLRDDEPQMNITLLEMLKQDFGITVSGLDPLPLDEHGVSIRDVFAVMRHAVMAQSRWDVLEASFLGIFSFSQFVMWNDIRNRYEDLERSKVVKSLMEGRLLWEARDMRLGDKVSEDEVLLPLAADASQLFAIESACKEESFVLHGPPGTGKSQTITALIANALAQGKTVLFVAEKMAALSVVQKRLDQLGIGSFCLELHSNKSRKKDVLEQLQAATEVRGTSNGITEEDFAKAAERAALHREELNMYAQALHAVQRSRISLHEMVNLYEVNRSAEDTITLEQGFVASLRPDDLRYNETLLGRLIASARETGHPHGHKLRNLRKTAYSLQMSIAAPVALNRYFESIINMENQGKQFSSFLKINYPTKHADFISLYNLVCQILELIKRKKALLMSWTPQFFDLDGQALDAEWREASAKWFLPKFFAQSGISKRLRSYGKGTASTNSLGNEITQLVEYQRQEHLIHELLKAYEPGYSPANTNADWEAFPLDSFAKAWLEFKEAGDQLNTLLDLDLDNYEASDWVLGQKTICEDILGHLDELREWVVWNDIAHEARNAGLSGVVLAYEAGLAHEAVLPAYRKALYHALIIQTVEGDETLNRFSGAVFSEKVRQFRSIDRELMELTKREIFYRLAAKVPDFAREAAHSSELGILQRAIRSGGRGISIRKLFEQIPNLLPRLCPCMLMSPISAAQYLDPKRSLFDIVVFDEASQLPTCKAIGALARGKEAIVVGDPKQMPPTSFFSSNIVDEENIETEDLESVLDDCLAISMPQTHLLWHYRSRHESLIAFSNSQFYDNKLYTFPSVNDRESRVKLVPVDGYFDRGRSRQNQAEAEAVVAELLRRYKDPHLRKLSIGIVTFNIPQQNLIDDLFNEACQTDDGLETWARDSEEPLFVKNLENVQGDERDVILFSIGYGPDKEGKIMMNFGPLNREGGWRRLNVAVSRARYEMTVFSSLQPDKLDLSRTGARGVAALKAFLDYAKYGYMPEIIAKGESFRPVGIVDSICAALKIVGYETQLSVGHSDYRIDIGVIDPRDSQSYILGILLDGAAYGAAKTTRDRELAQLTVLHSLGWKTHRIWTLDWWNNRRKETEKLLELLKTLVEQKSEGSEETLAIDKRTAVTEANEAIGNGASRSEAIKNEDTLLASSFPSTSKAAASPPEPDVEIYAAVNLPYEALSANEYILPENATRIAAKFRLVLQDEAPISEMLLTKRVLQSYGIVRAGSRVQRHSVAILSNMRIQFTEQDGRKIYWNYTQDPGTYRSFRAAGEDNNRRDVKEVPVQEIANAACAVITEQIGLPGEDLIRETAKRLGYTRSGSAVVAAIEEGIAYGKVTGRIIVDSYGYVTLA